MQTPTDTTEESPINNAPLFTTQLGKRAVDALREGLCAMAEVENDDLSDTAASLLEIVEEAPKDTTMDYRGDLYVVKTSDKDVDPATVRRVLRALAWDVQQNTTTHEAHQEAQAALQTGCGAMIRNTAYALVAADYWETDGFSLRYP